MVLEDDVVVFEEDEVVGLTTGMTLLVSFGLLLVEVGALPVYTVCVFRYSIHLL
jgi:hypothetical protein